MDETTTHISSAGSIAVGRPAAGPWLARRAGIALLAAGVASEALYAAIAWMSESFVFGQGYEDRPIIPVLAAFAIAFAIYLAALAAAVHVQPGRWLTAAIVGPAVLFRATLLFSEPIQEIDIYRYLWDGAATAQGVSPFRYSPAQVLAANATSGVPEDLARLVMIRDRSPALREILGRIHFPELPTVYPPVSQAVFAASHSLTLAHASIRQRVFVMKAVVTAFDLATIWLVMRLLVWSGRHSGWVVAYAWCPLVLKEFANSGHLDSIAVFFTTAGICCVVEGASVSLGRAASRKVWFAPLFLGLAVGAKLYPLVLAPWFIAICGARLGWQKAIAVALLFVVVSVIAVIPMLDTELPHPTSDTGQALTPSRPGAGPTPASAVQPDPLAGLRTFLGRWKMNDFLFLLVVENIRPGRTDSRLHQPWFSVVPEKWRTHVVAPIHARWELSDARASFLIARTITGVVFLWIAFWLACRAFRHDSPDIRLETAFLTLAWFWLLSPTQNPWYWTWSLPLLPFARSRAWLAVSGTSFLYYLRFWLMYHWPEQPVLGSDYNGAQFFDFVVPWIEYAPWFLLLLGEAGWRWRGRARDSLLHGVGVESRQGG